MNTSSHRSRVTAMSRSLRELSARREVLMLLLIAAETMIVYIFAGTLLAEREQPHSPLPVLVIFTVLLVARIVPHLLETIRIWSPEYEIIMTGAILVTMLSVIKIGAFPDSSLFSLSWLQGALNALILQENDSIRPVWMLIAFTGYAWWRGRTRAEATLETGYSMLRLGLIWLAGAILVTVAIAPAGAEILTAINTTVIGFLVFTLLAIAIARQPEGADSAAWNANWIWILIFAIPILAIAATTISTVGVLTRDTLDLFLTILAPVFWIVRIMLQAIVLAIAVIAFLLVSPLIWFLDRQGFRPLSNLPDINLSPGGQFDNDSFASTTLQIENPIRYLVAGLILLALFWFLVRFAFRRKRIWQERSGLQRESLIDWDDSPATLMQRVRNWVAVQFRSANPYAWPENPEWAATRRIRQIYQRFLRLNRNREIPRLPGETPAAFGNRLSLREPRFSDEIAQMTRCYNEARYSGKPAKPADADQAEAAYRMFLDGVRNGRI